jgi:predicted transcriptional regulator
VMVLTRTEREKLVKDLYEQGRTYKEIAKEVRISPRDIKIIVDKAIEQKEKEGQNERIQDNNGNDDTRKARQQLSPATQAYQSFSENRTPAEVAIALDMRESEIATYYREYWKLNDLHTLNSLYEEITADGITHFLRLYRYAKAAQMDARQVLKLLKIANNDLPLLEDRCRKLKRETDGLEHEKSSLKTTLRNLEEQIISANQLLDCYRISCREEIKQTRYWRGEKTRLRRLVRRFKNNSEEYLKIKNTVEEKVCSILLDGKGLLKLAFFSLMDSMRKDPDKYSSLIHYNNKLQSNDIGRQYSVSSTYGEKPQYPSYYYFFEAYKIMLMEDAERLYEQLLQEQTNSIIANYIFDKCSSSSPMHAIANQTYRYRKRITFMR